MKPLDPEQRRRNKERAAEIRARLNGDRDEPQPEQPTNDAELLESQLGAVIVNEESHP